MLLISNHFFFTFLNSKHLKFLVIIHICMYKIASHFPFFGIGTFRNLDYETREEEE